MSSTSMSDEARGVAAIPAALPHAPRATGQPIADVYVVRIGKEDADDLEFRLVSQRAERVEAFTALALARKLLQRAGMKV